MAQVGCALTGVGFAYGAAAKPAHPDTDWADLTHYRADNTALEKSGAAVDCVLMGDSITERWRQLRPGFFPAGRVCRGITGQTTPQMLVRFRTDVIRLRPAVVHIMAGTNDLAGNTGPETHDTIEGNIVSMVELALANGIGVVLASIPPAARYGWAPGTEAAQSTREMNVRLQSLTQQMKIVYADYYSLLDDGHGGLSPSMSTGDVHPTAPAYAKIEPLALTSIEQARAMPKHSLCPR